MQNKWYVIINPVSGGRKAPKLWQKLNLLVENSTLEFHIATTNKVYHAFELSKQAAMDGYLNFLIIGGDGTANEVINGICNSNTSISNMTIAMLSVGTGNDWVKSIGMPSKMSMVKESLIRKEFMLHDIGKISFMYNTYIKERYFVNIAGLGFDGLVSKKLSEGSGFMSGTKVRYWVAILRSLFFYKHTLLTITVDEKTYSTTALSVACGIGKFNGGGLMQLPFSKFDDGILDMTIIGEMSKLKMVLSLPKLTKGTFVNMKEIIMLSGKEFYIESAGPIPIETEGEYLGETPAKITIQKQAIRILKWL